MEKKIEWGKLKFNKIVNCVEQNHVLDIDMAVMGELSNIKLNEKIKPGFKIGITAGSRGICNIDKIIRVVVAYIKANGGIPYIIPSMGSHGGATTEGQVKMLSNLGISEVSMGCEILGSMEVIDLGLTESGYTAYTDKLASELDGIFVINRIKPHTDFDNDLESGIVKMVSVGMGNQIGCNHIHSLGLKKGVREVGEYLLSKLNILGGLGIVENSHDKTYLIKGVLKKDFVVEDMKMLELSKELIPRLPIDDIDVLVLKEIGKTYSGTGMDTKVIGRIKINGTPDPVKPSINMIVALNLSDASDGNALGVGLADLITQKFYDKIDFKKTYANVISTTYLERGKVPIILSNDKEAIETALNCIGQKEDIEKNIVIINNTLDLGTILISENVDSRMYSDRYKIIESGIVVKFDESGNLINY